MGTPLEISVPRVRVKRATAILRRTAPTTGTFSSKPSIIIRPCGVPYQNFVAIPAPMAKTKIINP